MIKRAQAKNFYLNNFSTNAFDITSKTYINYMSALKTIYDETLKDDYHFVEKYPYTQDLKPSVFDYDESFVDVLVEHGIDLYIKDVIGLNLCLSHIQIRNAHPYPDGKSSYQEWHRDTYVYDGNFSGMFPPGLKLIFYPHFDREPQPVLACVPNTALTMQYDRASDFSQITENRIHTINSSNDTYFIFNTSMLHSTLPAREKNLRIIYCFNYEHSLDEHAKKCQEMWKDMTA